MNPKIFKCIIFLIAIFVQLRSEKSRNQNYEINQQIYETVNDLTCQMGTFTNIDSLITVCHKNEYIEGMVALINHKIGMAMVNGREDAIYEMADYYENLARQSVQYGLQNKWAFNKIISLNIKSYYEPGEIYAEDLISIIDRDDLIISDELRVAVYKILSNPQKYQKTKNDILKK